MAVFDFSTLNSTDLEELVCDILNVQERDLNSRIQFRTFREGKDQGIDLLYSTATNSHEIVGQVKHYYNSTFKLLFDDLKRKERDKVIALNPERYIFATSLSLTPFQKKSIYQLFKPYIRSLEDIYAKKDLNRLLESYPSIFNNHFKLWFSSTEVLHKLTRYVQIGKALEFEENQLKRNFRLYVRTGSFDDAVNILRQHHFIVVKGDPGVGKTALAEMLVYAYIKDGYQLTYLTGDVVGLDKLIDQDDNKQIFYFDDFLGHTEMEIAKAKASEGVLLNFMNRFTWRKNKKFILTTRTHILKTLESESERFRQFKVKLKENTVLLDDYTDDLKLQLLRNHVEESLLSPALKNVLMRSDIQEFIITNTNFYPRSVEYITEKENILTDDPVEFEKFIIENFDKPDKIWRHAYEQQITDIDRWLLNTLLTFGPSAKFTALESAFTKRIDYEVQFQNLQRPMNAFNKSYRRLLGSFLDTEQPDDQMISMSPTVSLVNHSLQDFVFNYLREDKSEVIRIADSAKFAEQLTKMLFPLSDSLLGVTLPERLKMRLINEPHSFIGPHKDTDLLTIALTLIKYTPAGESEITALNLFKEVSDWPGLGPEFILIENLKILLRSRNDQPFVNTIKQIGTSLFEPIVGWLYDFDEVKSWDRLMKEKYDLLIGDMFIEADVDWPLYFREILDGLKGEIIDKLRLEPFDQEKVEEAKRSMLKIRDEMRSTYLIFPKFSLDEFNDYELEMTQSR